MLLRRSSRVLGAAFDAVADLAGGFYGADYFAGEDVEFVGGGFLDEQGAAVFGGIIFDHAHGEARAEIAGVLGGGDGERGILAHSFEVRAGEGREFESVHQRGVGLRNRRGGIGGGPVIGVFRRAELGFSGTAVGIEGGEGTVNDHQRYFLQLDGKFDEDFFGDLIFRDFELAEAGAESVTGADDEVEIVALIFGEGALGKSNLQLGDAGGDGVAQNLWVVKLFVHGVAASDEIEIHPRGAARLAE